jgi:hypothetical protein
MRSTRETAETFRALQPRAKIRLSTPSGPAGRRRRCWWLLAGLWWLGWPGRVLFDAALVGGRIKPEAVLLGTFVVEQVGNEPGAPVQSVGGPLDVSRDR